jgi:peptide/nickel transport system ATP-binding protein
MMELGSRNALRSQPFRPYSDLLISSVPELRTGWLDGIGDVHLKEASTEVPAGRSSQARSFYRRCALRVPGLCDSAPAPVRHLAKGADIRCQRTGGGTFEVCSGPCAHACRRVFRKTRPAAIGAHAESQITCGFKIT